MQDFQGKKVLVTGACGTVGSELVRQLAESPAEHIVCLDNNESELFFLGETYRHLSKVSVHLADVRDFNSLSMRMSGVDIILHAAALKHVGICEDSPAQAISTNIMGTQNVIDAALLHKVERVIFTSSDKAVNPTSVMGVSKLMGERLMTAAAQVAMSRDDEASTIFASTRFGNVLGSRGSVVPLFKRQIQGGGPITLTDKEMTRFIMTLEEAASLVLESVWMVSGGEVMVTKMPVAKIQDIANVMVAETQASKSVEVIEIGAKPGEKMYEELMNDEEVRRTYEHGRFFVVMSAFADLSADCFKYLAGCGKPSKPYNSALEPAMDNSELRDYLKTAGVIG